jgi:UDP-glucuronate 4-epimerase
LQNDLILVTGAAGFIGFHTAKRLLADGYSVLGADNLSDYYDVALKEARLKILCAEPGFRYERIDLANRPETERLFHDRPIRRVVHLAAQPGVRYSVDHPHVYADSNLVAFLNVLEGCRARKVDHLVFASSSSVYGGSGRLPFSTHDPADHPVSLYAATKKANELMAHSYAHLYGIPCTGLRLFTVYGPWGRPDMALFGFTKAILAGQPIDIYNNGNMRRDFTYVDDIVESIVRLLPLPAAPKPGWDNQAPDLAASFAAYRIFNVGNHQPVQLLDFIQVLEKALGRTAAKRFLPMQPGDVVDTFADVGELIEVTRFAPCTPIETGIARFVEWYRGYYSLH